MLRIVVISMTLPICVISIRKEVCRLLSDVTDVCISRRSIRIDNGQTAPLQIVVYTSIQSVLLLGRFDPEDPDGDDPEDMNMQGRFTVIK